MERLPHGKYNQQNQEIQLQKESEKIIVNFLKQPDKKSEKSPFVIRGHHLNIFVDIVRGYAEPEDLAWEDRNARENERNMPFPEKTAANREEILYVRGERKYARDMIGKTKREADIYEQKNVELYHNFLQLPDEYPMNIVIGKKDEICKACTIGKHCSMKYQSMFNGGESISSDGMYVGVFFNIAKKMNLGSEMQIYEEIVEFSDAEPQRVIGIMTNAGVVRKVLEDRSFRRIAKLRDGQSGFGEKFIADHLGNNPA